MLTNRMEAKRGGGNAAFCFPGGQQIILRILVQM